MPLADSNNTMATVAISGASGLVGQALAAMFQQRRWRVERLVRGEVRDAAKEIRWNPDTGSIDAGRLSQLDAIVHLAGDGIASGRWTAAKKERIRTSRIDATRRLAQTLAGLAKPPRVLACASAIGFYGSRGDEIVNESSATGSGFLAEVCRDWEAATQPARDAGIRVVNLRFGVILSPRGGALAKMLTPFKLGLGGVIGSGQQFMSWIALDDAVGAIEHALSDSGLTGPVNLVSPNPVTNREFTKTLGAALGRPTIFPMPAFAARLAFGEMADEMLLSSTRVDPRRLRETGYQFQFPQLAGALRHVLGR